jgi:hypothetical protein
MAQPVISTVTVDSDSFKVLSAHFGVSTTHDQMGMPLMGSLQCAVDCVVDVHDTDNMPYTLMQKLFTLANVATKAKIVSIKLEFWTDDGQQDALCTQSFQGWISSWSISSGSGSNHTLHLSFQPQLSANNYAELMMGN